MKQLLIVNSAKALNAGLTDSKVTDLSTLQAGAITVFELGATTALASTPSKNFGIALGGGSGKMPFVIPEVDYDTVVITHALPVLGKKFKRKFTFPTPVEGKDYTVVFIKKNVVPHERNTWTVTLTAGSTTAATEATAFKAAIDAKLGDKFNVSVATAAITIECKTIGEQWEAKFADNLTGTSWAGSTDFVEAEPTIGDKAYIQDLASRCAAGKGFNDTQAYGESIYPGYPEAVEDLTPSSSTYGSSTDGYAVITLRFKVGRAASKTRDERVAQLVHIAIPVKSGSAYNDLKAILPEGVLSANISDKVKALVKSTALKSS